MADNLGASLESTPTWAVSGVCFVLILVALAIEHALHELTLLLERKKRKALNQALSHIKAELRSLGFMSLLLTVAKQPISKICIPAALGDSFLPCRDAAQPGSFTEELSCQEKGKISLISSQGTQQLQILIIVLAVFHILSSLVTLLLGEAKMKRWNTWEEETKTLDYQLSNDPRRFKLPRQTSFGERHLKVWSNHHVILWIVCFFRQFTDSVSKADYFSLRHGFIAVHFSRDSEFDFRKFLQRSLDKDFAVVVSISFWIWMYAVFFIFFSAYDLYSHFWLSFVPLVVLLVIGTKLEVIITTMCLKSSNQAIVVPGTISVEPDNKNFWFGQPQLLLHLMQFILIQNSFQLAFFTWTWYNFGLRSCFHRDVADIILSFGLGIIVQFLCAYITLPLYALVTQMTSSMKETIFTDEVIQSLKDWRRRARKNLSKQRSFTPDTWNARSLAPSTDQVSPSSSNAPRKEKLKNPITSFTDHASSSSSSTPRALEFKNPSSLIDQASPSCHSTPKKFEFKFPSGRLELLEVQRVVEEIIQHALTRQLLGQLIQPFLLHFSHYKSTLSISHTLHRNQLAPNGRLLLLLHHLHGTPPAAALRRPFGVRRSSARPDGGAAQPHRNSGEGRPVHHLPPLAQGHPGGGADREPAQQLLQWPYHLRPHRQRLQWPQARHAQQPHLPRAGLPRALPRAPALLQPNALPDNQQPGQHAGLRQHRRVHGQHHQQRQPGQRVHGGRRGSGQQQPPHGLPPRGVHHRQGAATKRAVRGEAALVGAAAGRGAEEAQEGRRGGGGRARGGRRSDDVGCGQLRVVEKSCGCGRGIAGVHCECSLGVAVLCVAVEINGFARLVVIGCRSE